MSVFARKVSAGSGRPWRWIGALAIATAVLVPVVMSARAEAAVVEWTPYSGSAQFTDDSCGYPVAVASTFSGRFGLRTGTGPATSYFFVTDNYSVREVHTDLAVR